MEVGDVDMGECGGVQERYLALPGEGRARSRPSDAGSLLKHQAGNKDETAASA